MSTYRSIIVMGPSGVGKTYLAKQLIARNPDSIMHAPVFVTRKKRKHENEIAVGREFIDVGSVDDREYLFKEFFANNWYCYKRSSLENSSNHVIVDVSPHLIDKAKKYVEDPIIVGMIPSKNVTQALISRLQSRGDSPKIIDERQSFISRDIEDLQKIKGVPDIKFFIIHDDSTIPKSVVPWIEEQLNL